MLLRSEQVDQVEVAEVTSLGSSQDSISNEVNTTYAHWILSFYLFREIKQKLLFLTTAGFDMQHMDIF